MPLVIPGTELGLGIAEVLGLLAQAQIQGVGGGGGLMASCPYCAGQDTVAWDGSGIWRGWQACVRSLASVVAVRRSPDHLCRMQAHM